jgi:hypothetical protein
MNDRTNQLESRLSQLRPRPLSESLIRRVGAELSRRPARVHRDGFFWCALAGGAIAASVIIAVLLNEPRGVRAMGSISVAQGDANSSLTTLAQAGGQWGDELKLASDWSQP